MPSGFSIQHRTDAAMHGMDLIQVQVEDGFIQNWFWTIGFLLSYLLHTFFVMIHVASKWSQNRWSGERANKKVAMHRYVSIKHIIYLANIRFPPKWIYDLSVACLAIWLFLIWKLRKKNVGIVDDARRSNCEIKLFGRMFSLVSQSALRISSIDPEADV